jgi:hypothetical protein
MDATTQAAISMLGMSLDAYGGLLLAYDLLGGRHGPLRWLLRTSTYSFVFTAMFVPVFRLQFALLAGIGLGGILAYELHQAARSNGSRRIGNRLPVAIARCSVLGLAIGLSFHIALGVWFVLVGSAFATVAILAGKVRGIEYKVDSMPKITRANLGLAVSRGALVGVTGLVSGALAGDGSSLIWFAAEVGLTVGMCIACLGVVAPLVEAWVDRVPDKLLGHVGAVLFVLGFFLQAAPSAEILIH